PHTRFGFLLTVNLRRVRTGEFLCPRENCLLTLLPLRRVFLQTQDTLRYVRGILEGLTLLGGDVKTPDIEPRTRWSSVGSKSKGFPGRGSDFFSSGGGVKRPLHQRGRNRETSHLGGARKLKSLANPNT